MGTFVVDGSGRPVSVSDHGITITVTVPAGALPVGTTIAIYRGDSSVLGGFLPAHKSYVDGYAVGWTAPDGSRPSAGSPIRIVVADGHAKAADILFVSSQSGLSPTTVPVSTGSWSTTFTADPGFVLAQAASAPATASPAPANTAPGTITSPSTGGAPVASNATPWWGWVAAVLALLALGGFVRRVRARG